VASNQGARSRIQGVLRSTIRPPLVAVAASTPPHDAPLRAGPTLVTGAAGFVGRHLLEQLVAAGTPVVAWRRPGKDPADLTDAVSWAAVDLLERDAVARALSEVTPNAIYHLAGAAHVAESWQQTVETYRSNVIGTHHLLTAVRDVTPGARVLVACSASVYKPQPRPLRETDPIAPSSPYATSKLAQELLARQMWDDERVAALIARSFNHTGPGQDPSYVASGIARQIARIEAGLQEPILRLGNLEPRRDLSDVRDVVRAYGAMMAHATPGTPYNVCSGREMSIRSLVETFVSRANARITVVQEPALFRPNDLPLLLGDHSRLSTDTGWAPRISLDQTVDDLLAYWRQQVRR
jgi:GDP-4-dehydro-6-deoxy-D-mannose reductase